MGLGARGRERGEEHVDRSAGMEEWRQKRGDGSVGPVVTFRGGMESFFFLSL